MAVVVAVSATLVAGWLIQPEGATKVMDVNYAEAGDPGIIYDAHTYMRQFHTFRSFANTSYRVEARNSRISGVDCPKIDVVRVFTIFGLKVGRFWIGCVESGFVD